MSNYYSGMLFFVFLSSPFSPYGDQVLENIKKAHHFCDMPSNACGVLLSQGAPPTTFAGLRNPINGEFLRHLLSLDSHGRVSIPSLDRL
ncbi:hypothetical protein, partial [Texcoconibacillus texcoconensis]|uniref:hypothetical protein n=1 Tax=Texcoconibacillus texcoconensis TaxID=1095777 RepID=UPI001C84B5FC